MPTTKPRLYMTLAPRTDAVLRTLANLHGAPVSQVATSVLDAAVPALESVVKAVDQLESKVQGADALVAKVVRRMIQDAAAQGLLLSDVDVRMPPRKADAGGLRGGRSAARTGRRKRLGTPAL